MCTKEPNLFIFDKTNISQNEIVTSRMNSRGEIMIKKQPDGRVQWIDAAKGLGIILVVVGHTLRGLESGNVLSFEGDFGQIDKAIYSFHMPLMFLLSGLFINRALPQSWLSYILKHTQRLIWPLILWTYIFFLCKIVAGGAANSPVGWQNFPYVPLPPKEHFWFLWALFLCFIIIKVVDAFCTILKIQLVSWALVTLAALLFSVLWQSTGQYSPWMQQAFEYLPYITVGMSLRILFVSNPLCTLTASIIGFCATLVTPLGGIPALYNFGVAVSLSVAVISATAILSNYITCAWLVVIGRASMAIYLSHTIVSALGRAILMALHVNDVAVHIVVGIALGLLVPLVGFISIKDQRTLKIIGW